MLQRFWPYFVVVKKFILNWRNAGLAEIHVFNTPLVAPPRIYEHVLLAIVLSDLIPQQAFAYKSQKHEAFIQSAAWIRQASFNLTFQFAAKL